MPTVNISYSLEADAKNWLRIFRKTVASHGLSRNQELSFIPGELLTSLTHAAPTDQEILIREHLEKQKATQNLITIEVAALKKAWRTREKTFFALLEKLTGHKIYSSKFNAQLTTASLAPYDADHSWFMIHAAHPLARQITGIAHELFHLQFEHYYKKSCLEQMTSEQFEMFKESLTVLLNEPLFESIIASKDVGYPAHAEIRKQIVNDWHSEPSISALLSKFVTEKKKGQA